MCKPSGTNASSVSNNLSQRASVSVSEKSNISACSRIKAANSGLAVSSSSISRQRTKLSFNSCNPLYKPAAITGGVRCVMVTALLRLLAKLASEGLLHA